MFTHRQEDKTPGMLLALVAVFGITITAIMYTFSEGISGNDFWWHIKVGEWVVTNGSVPTTDIFSWYGTARKIPWTAHEWLADVILYLVHSFFGDGGVFGLSLIAALCMTIMLWRDAKEYVERNILIGGLYFVLLAVTTSVFFYGRPHLFGYFLLYWELKVLYAYVSDPNSKGVYSIPVLACLWSNIHGGSASLAYGLCVVFLVVGLLNLRIGRIEPTRLEKKSLIKLLVITICAVGAILINPVGVEVLLYPYKSFGDQLQMTLISEWRSPDAKEIGDLILFIIPIVLMLIGFFAEEKRIRLLDLSVMGVFVLLFFRSVRFIMLWYIAAPFCAFQYVPLCKIKPMSQKSEKTIIVVCLVVFAILIGVAGVNIYETANDEELISVTMSDEAISAVKSDNPLRIFNDYNLGEALIFNEIPVFFDARADLYTYEGMMADGVSLMFLEQANSAAETSYVDVDGLIEKYEFDAILILKTRALYSYLISHPDQFVCVYEDNSVGYFRVVQ